MEDALPSCFAIAKGEASPQPSIPSCCTRTQTFLVWDVVPRLMVKGNRLFTVKVSTPMRITFMGFDTTALQKLIPSYLALDQPTLDEAVDVSRKKHNSISPAKPGASAAWRK